MLMYLLIYTLYAVHITYACTHAHTLSVSHTSHIHLLFFKKRNVYSSSAYLLGNI